MRINAERKSSWFITCNGAFLEEELRENRPFHISIIHNYLIEDNIIFSIMVYPDHS